MLPENMIIDYLVSKYGSIFTDSEGGINPVGIKYALELEEIEDKPLIAHKIIVYVRAGLDIQRSRSD